MFSDLITETFSSFTAVITGLAGGVKAAFTNLMYVDPLAEKLEFAPVIVFLFTILGLGFATGVFYKIFGLIKRRG